MKKIIIFLIILVALGFVGCYMWINMGLSQAVSEKTLNISYDEFMYDENIQRLDLQMEKTYEGGPLFDEDTFYEAKKVNNNIERKIRIIVDSSTKELEQISIHYDINENKELLSAQLDASLFAEFFSSCIDKNRTEEVSLSITKLIMNPNDIMKSFISNGIEYSVGLIDGFAFVIAPEN